MALFRRVLGGDGEDGMEEEALLAHEAGSSSSSTQMSSDDEAGGEDNTGRSQFDASLPARHLVSRAAAMNYVA